MFGKANNSNSQGENAREYEYEKEKQTEKQSIGKNKEFIFKYSQDEKLRKKLKTPRSRAYMEALSMIDLLSATDDEIIEKLQSEMDEDTLEEISEMSAEEIIAEIMTSVREELETAIEEAGEQLVGNGSKEKDYAAYYGALNYLESMNYDLKGYGFITKDMTADNVGKNEVLDETTGVIRNKKNGKITDAASIFLWN